MKNFYQRKSPRLQGYDYSQSGAYFITICTHERQHLFGQIVEGEMLCNAPGDIAAELWEAIPLHYPELELDAFVVMPNHVHGILCLLENGTKLAHVISSYKGAVTLAIRKQKNDSLKVWQGRYHDHIIRNEKSLNYIREYVATNPQRWLADSFYG